MESTATTELIAVTEKLLAAIATTDWTTYTELCDPTLTAFEPEGKGHLIEGMPFHRFYFELDGAGPAHKQNTLANTHVRLLGDVGIVSYVRLTQKLDPHGVPVTVAMEETRVWQRQNGKWRHVHFHRSPA